MEGALRSSTVMRPALRQRWSGSTTVPAARSPAWSRARSGAGTSRSRSDRQGSRHLWQRHPQQVVQRDDRAMAGIQVPERLVHHLAVGQGAREVGRHRRVDGRDLDLDGAVVADGAPRSRQAWTVSFWSQPSNVIGVTQARQVSPGPDERLLDRVARELRVPKDESSCRVQPRKSRVDQVSEGLMIASLRPFDAVLAGPRSPRMRHGRGGHARTLWRRRHAKGSVHGAGIGPEGAPDAFRACRSAATCQRPRSGGGRRRRRRRRSPRRGRRRPQAWRPRLARCRRGFGPRRSAAGSRSGPASVRPRSR